MSEAPLAKRPRMDSPKVIGTHNGTFHCDEALAVFLLRQTPTYRDSAVKRSRDPAVLDSCDIVVDVGAIYDEAKQRFDHHQRGFTEVFGYDFETKLSSAGLIYKYPYFSFFDHACLTRKSRHFGKEIIANRLQLEADNPKVHTLWLKLYKEFIEAIDAIDNGISQYPAELKAKYRSRTDLSSRVSQLNPAWNQSLDSEGMDSQFAKASTLTGQEFLGRLDYYANAWLPARDLLLDSLAKSKQDVDPSGKIVLLEQFLPWKEHLFEIETATASTEPAAATYIVYGDGTSSDWRVQAVPLTPDSFESRKALPEKWRGLRDDELSSVSGIPGGVFVHASGFIGGNKTKDGAIKLAKLALKL
ncbi:metal-dependent protein hydrolase [Mycena floridula]|nr:metal-dependent protein hydrolase [Mycena floridula]